MNPKVDFFFTRAQQWGGEYAQLRMLALGCGLTEELKWGVPCYTWEGKNVVLIHGFKDYCALLFHKGVLLKDPEKLLIRQTENVQSARQMRFTGVNEIVKYRAAIRAYIKEAIALEQAGAKVAFKKSSAYTLPAEFKKRLDEMPELKKAFYALTPGRQKGYLLHFASAKQAKTREARVEKYIPQILSGKGIDD